MGVYFQKESWKAPSEVSSYATAIAVTGGKLLRPKQSRNCGYEIGMGPAGISRNRTTSCPSSEVEKCAEKHKRCMNLGFSGLLHGDCVG